MGIRTKAKAAVIDIPSIINDTVQTSENLWSASKIKSEMATSTIAGGGIFWESAAVPLSSSVKQSGDYELITIPHPIGTIPSISLYKLQCTIAERGYVPGDILHVSSGGASTSDAFIIQASATEFKLICNRHTWDCFALPSKQTDTAFNPTRANWSVIVMGWSALGAGVVGDTSGGVWTEKWTGTLTGYATTVSNIWGPGTYMLLAEASLTGVGDILTQFIHIPTQALAGIVDYHFASSYQYDHAGGTGKCGVRYRVATNDFQLMNSLDKLHKIYKFETIPTYSDLKYVPISSTTENGGSLAVYKSLTTGNGTTTFSFTLNNLSGVDYNATLVRGIYVDIETDCWDDDELSVSVRYPDSVLRKVWQVDTQNTHIVRVDNQKTALIPVNNAQTVFEISCNASRGGGSSSGFVRATIIGAQQTITAPASVILPNRFSTKVSTAIVWPSSSSVWADIPQLTISETFTEGPVAISASISLMSTSASQNKAVRITLDDVPIATQTWRYVDYEYGILFSPSALVDMTSGPHTIKVQYKCADSVTNQGAAGYTEVNDLTLMTH